METSASLQKTAIEAHVSVITVTFNSRTVIAGALEELADAATTGAVHYFVVDNCSSDGTAAFVEETFPWARLIRNDTNVGFGRANNQAMALVDTPYVLFLNPDASIDFEALEDLRTFMDRNPAVGICGPFISDPAVDGIQFIAPFPSPGAYVRQALSSKHRRARVAAVNAGQGSVRVDWLPGAVLLVRKSLMDRLNGFDPAFFLYFEETDLCLRARKAGFATHLVRDATAQHDAGTGSVAKRRTNVRGYDMLAEDFYRSRFYYLVKHFGRPAAVAVDFVESVVCAAVAVRARIRRRPLDNEARVRLAALFSRFRRLGGFHG